MLEFTLKYIYFEIYTTGGVYKSIARKQSYLIIVQPSPTLYSVHMI